MSTDPFTPLGAAAQAGPPQDEKASRFAPPSWNLTMREQQIYEAGFYRGGLAALSASRTDPPTQLLMADIRVGMRLRDPRSDYFPLMTVTAITDKGFSYVLDRPHSLGSRLGVTASGEHYGLDGKCLYELVPSRTDPAVPSPLASEPTHQETRDDMRVIHSSEIADDPAGFEGDYVPLGEVEAAIAHRLAVSALSSPSVAESPTPKCGHKTPMSPWCAICYTFDWEKYWKAQRSASSVSAAAKKD